MDMPLNVPVDNPEADTEWNDILRKHGVIPEKPPDPEPLIQEALLEAHQRAHDNRLDDKSLDELDALEDDEDEAFLESYRQKRLHELSSIQKASVYGQVYHLQKPDYARDVTEASSQAFVLVNLTSSLGNNVESRVLTELWSEMARKYGDVKFCQIRADLCIEGYPERNTPTILVYKDGDIKRQVVTLREMAGVRTSLQDLERLLIDIGAVAENDVRAKRKEIRNSTKSSGIRQSSRDQDSDEDWD